MVKFVIIKIEQPNCFMGKDLSLFDNVSAVCHQIKSGDSATTVLPASDIVEQRIYLADLVAEVVRVRVLQCINSNTYRCLLIDHGKIEEIKRHKIYNLPPNRLDMDPAIKMIKIPGIRPSGMSDVRHGAHISVELSESDKWMPASFKFVSRIFEEQSTVHVNYLKRVSRDKSFADVMIIYRNQRENLKELLIKEGYAFLSKENDMEILDKQMNDLSTGTDSTQPNTAVNQREEVDTEKFEVESVSTVDSLENESISMIIDNMKKDDNNLKFVSTREYSSSNYMGQNNSCTPSLSSMTRSSVHGTLDELNQQILNLKVKSWCVSRSMNRERNDFDIKYLNTVRPILSYRNEPLLESFLKDAMIAYDTKLLLLIQAFMIPTILRGLNMVAISPQRKGKSMGLLMPILQTIAKKQFLPSRSFNPLAIILCSSWKKVKDLSNSAEKFTRFIVEAPNVRKPRVVAAYGGSLKKMTMMSVLQGCDILIITPKCLLGWLKQHEFFKLNELEIFCLDDAENIIAEHLQTLQEILIYKRTGAIDRGTEPGQFITATHWTSGLESYVKHEMGDIFSVVVNDPLEIAVIERIKQKIIEYDDVEGELYQKLVDYLNLTQCSIKRTIIFASDDSELASVYKYLMQKANVDLKLMTGSMSSEELNLIVKEWNQYRGYVNMPLLLISDEALRSSDISIFNAQIIIHVDVHESSFGNRLNFLRDKYQELTFLKPKSTKSTDEHEKFSSFIFACPKTISLSTSNFLYRFLGRCNSDRPSWLQDKAVDYILMKEKSKGCNEICPRIKSYGECKLPGCVKRHMVISDIDKPLLPNRGYIQFRLLYLESPSHFYVRIMEFKNTDGTDTVFKSQYLSLKMKMSNYFNNPQNIHGVNLRLVQIGLMAAIKTKDILERVVVTKMKSNKSGCVVVKLIDKGSEMVVEQADLLHLPRDLSEIDPQAFEIYVTGIKPVDNDEFYGEETCKFTKEFLEDRDLYGIIRLCIGSTLWIDGVTQKVHHHQTNVTVFDMNLAVTLYDKNLIEKNPQHIDKLVRLCTGKIDIWKPSSDELSVQPVPIMRKFSYNPMPIVFEKLSIIDDDNQFDTECLLAHLISPNFIFLNNRDTIQSLRDMQNEIDSLIDSIETLSIKDVRVGSRVLFYKDSKWHRGYVIKVRSNIQIFSLDFGSIESYNSDDCVMKKLPSEYQQLPYQAILCSLYYCSHQNNSYSENVNAAIKHYASDKGNKNACLTVIVYHDESITGEMFSQDNLDNLSEISQMDLFDNLTRFHVTISNRCLRKSDEMLHDVLIRNQDTLPSAPWLQEVLPESSPYASRLVRNGSIPHLTSDILCTKDVEKRMKLFQTIERIIDKKKEAYTISGSVSTNITSILHSLSIIIHFINDQPMYMSIYRCLNSLLSFAYEKNHVIENSIDKETFSIKYVTTLLLSYDSIIFHMLRHLETSSRSGQIENCRIILDNFRMMLLDPSMVTCLFSESTWYVVMATCIAALQSSEHVYNLLMDILVQLVMLWDDHNPVLSGLLHQSCLTLKDCTCPSIFNSSLALISCFVNKQDYSSVFRNINFFEILFDKFIDHYYKIGEWDEILENSLDVMSNMWRNGSASQRQILRRRKLSVDIEDIRLKYVGNTRLGRFVTDILLEESSVSVDKDNSSVVNGDSVNNHCGRYGPDPDTLDWIEGREFIAKKYRKSYKRIICDSDSTTSSDEDDVNESDSDSSDVEVDPFLNGNANPADEDNVPCFEKA